MGVAVIILLTIQQWLDPAPCPAIAGFVLPAGVRRLIPATVSSASGAGREMVANLGISYNFQSIK